MAKSDQKDVQARTKGNMDWIKSQGDANRAVIGDVYNRSVAASQEMYPGITAGYGDIAGVTGGYDPTTLNTINTAYTGLAQGGYTPGDIGALKREATAGVSGAIGGLTDTARRLSAATGSSGSGALSRMARTAGETSARAVTGVNADIARQKAANIATGAGGLSSVQQAITGQRLGALGGASNIYGMNMQQMSDSVRNIIQNYQATGNMSNQDLQILQEISKRPGIFDNIMRGLGVVAGGASAIMGIPGLKSSSGGGSVSAMGSSNPFPGMRA